VERADVPGLEAALPGVGDAHGFVIPGRYEAPNPESRLAFKVSWIPGSRLRAPWNDNVMETSLAMTSDEPAFPRIASSQSTRLSPWVSLIENRVVGAPDDGGAVYHSIDTMDYVSVLAVTADGRIPVVRQFRPAVRRFTLEFPGGMRDGDEAPEACAIRELAEEVGVAVSRVRPLVTMIPESGRLGNRMWTFFAPDAVPIPGWGPETGVAHMMVSIAELHALTLGGTFDHAPHIAMLGIAVMRGWLPPP
jgi:ADP-ribose pyrophosphatase